MSPFPNPWVTLRKWAPYLDTEGPECPFKFVSEGFALGKGAGPLSVWSLSPRTFSRVNHPWGLGWGLFSRMITSFSENILPSLFLWWQAYYPRSNLPGL